MPVLRLASLLLSCLLVGAVSSITNFADARSVAVGVNLSNPQALSPEDRERTLEALQRSGVTLIRVPLMDETSFELVRDASARGIKTLLLIGAMSPLEHGPKRPLVKEFPWAFSVYSLSDAKPEVFRSRVAKDLGRFEDMGVSLGAIELDSEINWVGFNGDFPVPGEGKNLNAYELEHDPVGRKVAAGFRKYVELAAILKQIRGHLKINHDVPILSAGLADSGIGTSGPEGKLDSVSIPVTLNYLRQHGLDASVDGYGVHVYPSGYVNMATPGIVEALRKDTFSACEGGTAKPCWVTEWGLPNDGQNCPLDDSTRAEATKHIRAAFQQFADKGELAGLIYYSWAGEPWSKPGGFDIFRCGTLTESGRIALAPLRRP